MKVLITGRSGQLTRELQIALPADVEQVVLGSAELNLADPEAIRQQVRAIRPDLILNPAAYTAVDLAESEVEQAMAINARAPGILAEEAAALGIPLIHYSTDYVFDGQKAGAYLETDATAPLNVYGRSKLAGEQAIRAVGGQHLILRTSWVYAGHGRNFLLTMQRLLQEKPHMKVVADQIGAPTWAGTLASTTAALIQHWRQGQAGPWGTYHLTCQGHTSWFGFAEAIAAHLQAEGKPNATLEPISAASWPTPATRPLNSRLDCQRLQADWQVELPAWETALQLCLAQQ